MTIHTYSDNVLVKPALNCALTNGTQHSAAIDTLAGNGAPFRRAAAVIDLVTGAATTAQVTISESADGSTGWTVVTGAANPATPQVASTPASGLAGAAYITNIDLAKRKRYLRADLVGTGTAGTGTVDFELFEGPYLAPTQDNSAVSV